MEVKIVNRSDADVIEVTRGTLAPEQLKERGNAITIELDADVHQCHVGSDNTEALVKVINRGPGPVSLYTGDAEPLAFVESIPEGVGRFHKVGLGLVVRLDETAAHPEAAAAGADSSSTAATSPEPAGAAPGSPDEA